MQIDSSSAPALSSFNWEYPFLLQNQLAEDERLIQQAANAYCSEKLAPRVLHAFTSEYTAPDIFQEMGAMGMLSIMIPETYGGLGLNCVCYGLVVSV